MVYNKMVEAVEKAAEYLNITPIEMLDRLGDTFEQVEDDSLDELTTETEKLGLYDPAIRHGSGRTNPRGPDGVTQSGR